jgi:hypothetical protein
MFLKSIYFPTNALCDIIHITHVKTIRSLSTQVASSVNYCNKDVQPNLPSGKWPNGKWPVVVLLDVNNTKSI